MLIEYMLAIGLETYITTVTVESGSERPNFSGKWRLNVSRSKLEIDVPTKAIFQIDHHDPMIHFKRTLVYGESFNTIDLDLTTDGKKYLFTFGESQMQTRAHWEGKALVFQSSVRFQEERCTIIVKYVLHDAGQTVIAFEELRSNKHGHDNVWVLERER